MKPIRSLTLTLLLAGCALPRPAAPSGAPEFEVAVFGDMPYVNAGDPGFEAGLAGYRAVLDTIAARDVRFVVHIGDLTGRTCSDSLFAQRVREFSALPHPLVYTPGDNEWTDCARDGYDALERLATVRRLFAPAGRSLGRDPIPLRRQSEDPAHAAYPENARWTVGGVVFATLHVVGTNNNRGRDPEPGPEYMTRNGANLVWLRESFREAERTGAPGIALFMQANPFTAVEPSGFTDLLDELQRLALAFGRPVALVHGDTHRFRVDHPLNHPATGRPLTTVTRAETYGNPEQHALRITVDPASPNVFRFEPLLARSGD